MKSSLNFLVAARQCEIDELEHLALTGNLVDLVGELIHALQKERGISNIWLGSRGLRYVQRRTDQIQTCQRIEHKVRVQFDALDTETARVHNGARLFSRIAVVLEGLDALPILRERIELLALSPEESTAAFVRLIAGLLAVVFEAADNATDPDVSRALVALFNFMQGKEFAGQERALGAAVFSAGRIDEARLDAWLHLIELQDSCFQIFNDFSQDTARSAWLAIEKSDTTTELKRLRSQGHAAPADGRLDARLSPSWFDIATLRLDMMRGLEDQLAGQHLRELCASKIVQARAELRDQQATVAALGRESTDPDVAALYGPHLERSLFGMMQAQSRRLQTMSDELDTVRAALNERKLIERAKGLLMASRKLSEDEAYKMMRQIAMTQGKRLIEIAESVLAMAHYL